MNSERNTDMKNHSILLYICFIALVLLLCLNSDFIAAGFAEGLQLWYNNLVPLLLPFLLLSGFFLSFVDFERPNKAACLLLLFICGLFCGYPIGAIAINKFYRHGVISKSFAYAVMPLCNNVSPMFLLGYIYRNYFAGQFSILFLLAAIYLPQICYVVLYLVLTHFYAGNRHAFFDSSLSADYAAPTDNTAACSECAATAAEHDSSIIETSIMNITVIGVYIAIFSVLYNIMTFYSHDLLPIKIAACFMEITKGIPGLDALISSPIQKTALILSVTSFGGVSSLLQSMHILKETKLSFLAYTFGKAICSLFTYLITVQILSCI